MFLQGTEKGQWIEKNIEGSAEHKCLSVGCSCTYTFGNYFFGTEDSCEWKFHGANVIK